MRRRVFLHLAVWTAWSVPAAFVTVLSLHERSLPPWPVLAAELLPWYFWAFLTLPIARHARAHPLESLRTVPGVLRHVTAALLIGAACGVITVLAEIAIGGDAAASRTPAQLFASAILFWCIFGLIFYALITAFGFAVDSQTRLREREVAASLLEARLVEAQLHGLRMQLQPHFLFNTLNAVAMYMRAGDATTSIRMLARLSELLRRVLDTGAAQQVELAVELEQVRRYLEIEGLRFPDRLRVEYDVDDVALTALVPNLALQPLVENAIRHGIARRAEGGVVRVSARRDGDALVIGVYNDGPSLPPGWSAAAADGIGLRNTRLRMQHLYDGRGELRLRNTGDGVLCEVVVPYHE